MENIDSLQKDFFLKNGYLLVKHVYSPADINNFQSIFSTAFRNKLWKEAKYNSATILNDIYRIFPDLIDIVINEKYVKILKAILGNDVIWLPECAVHYNRFINWHKDTTEQEIKGIKSHKVSNEFLLQCATYFQSNSNSGGGLTVIPGSHLARDRFINLYEKDIYSRIKNKVKKIFNVSVFDEINKNEKTITIPSEVGDLLIFDVRLDHKSTENTTDNNEIEKFAIFNTFGNSNRFTKDYLEFMKKRPEPYYQYLQKKPLSDNVYKKADSLNIKIWD